MENTIIKLDTFDGHLVLLCKGHYLKEKHDFFESLTKLWSVRCGLDYNGKESNGMFEAIADRMLKIILESKQYKVNYLYQTIHRELTKPLYFKPNDMSHIKALIWEYRVFLLKLQIKEESKVKYRTLISLPKLQKRIINRILKNGGNYSDYNLLMIKDQRK